MHNNAPIDTDNIGNIQSLRISGDAGNQLTDQDVLHLAAIPRLGHLTIGSAPQLTPAGLAHLADIEGLWNLNFRAAGLTDEQVSALAGLDGLRSLDLALNRQVTDAALPAIASIGGLETLTLDSTAVTDAGLGSLATPDAAACKRAADRHHRCRARALGHHQRPQEPGIERV